jgi:formate dehydrogenase subunit delta
MNSETLVRMANQIADFFKAQPEAEAIKGTADHIKLFWDPRMRRELCKHLAEGGEGLSRLARQAAELICI